MRKKTVNSIKMFSTAVLLASGMLISACGGSKEADAIDSTVHPEPITSAPTQPQETPQETEPEQVVEEVQETEERVVPEGMYANELSGEFVDEAIKNQRPVAIMVDFEKTALEHFGISDADILYELINSTANDRITRGMFIVKDWKKISQFGSIRSVRPTNIMLAPEYNAVLVHDGGPYYVDETFKQTGCPHLSGGFARIKNGKPTEFTEYVTTGELEKRMQGAGYSLEYDSKYEGQHHKISEAKIDLSQKSDVKNASSISLPFKHTSSALKYNSSTETYDHYLYSNAHVDAGNGNKVLTFTNVVIQKATLVQLDEHGYMLYNCVGSGEGYYCTGGKAIPIKWAKPTMTSRTVFTDMDGNEIEFNVGKSYFCMVPDDSWGSLSIN